MRILPGIYTFMLLIQQPARFAEKVHNNGRTKYAMKSILAIFLYMQYFYFTPKVFTIFPSGILGWDVLLSIHV